MIPEFLFQLGIWNWLVFGLILLILEILARLFSSSGSACRACQARWPSSVVHRRFWLAVANSYLSGAGNCLLRLPGAVFGSAAVPRASPCSNRRGEQLVGQRAR